MKDFQERVAKYREFSALARAEAARMTSAAARTGLLKLADEWDQLADEILKEYTEKQ